MMTSQPPLTPIAKLNGNRYSPKTGAYSESTAMAVIRLIAEGTPRGLSFFLSLGHFSNATR